MKIGSLNVHGIIYKIKNISNKKIYIGQTTKGFDKRYTLKGNCDIEKVYRSLLNLKKSNYNYNKSLLEGIKEYGFSNFHVIKVFDIAFSQYELNMKEEVWTTYYKANTKEKGYNTYVCHISTKEINTIRSQKALLRNKNKYNGYDEIRRKENYEKVICITTGEVFESVQKAGKHFNLSSYSIFRCCEHTRKYIGRDSTTGEKLIWEYYKETQNVLLK